MHATPTLLPMRRAALVHMCAGLLVLLGCVLAPRQGGAVLLIPVLAGHARAIPAGHVAILRPGWIAGSLLVRSDGEVSVMAMIRGGFVPIAAPSWLCGSPAPAGNSR